ncbi:MAG: hypothetical protein K0R46_1004 [Herbinix sp.]|nr:hypothetical protein [Herbinix sp.]
MKKFTKIVALLVCLLTLIAAPTYAYAETLPACTIKQPNLMLYEYVNGPRTILPNESFILSNYEGGLGGAYLVPATHFPAFSIGCNTTTPYQVFVYMISPAFAVVYQTVVTTGAANIVLPQNSYDRTILIEIIPLGDQPAYLSAYAYKYY